MYPKGKLEPLFIIKILGAVIGGIGFFLLAFRQSILGTALIGIGSLLIAIGER